MFGVEFSARMVSGTSVAAPEDTLFSMTAPGIMDARCRQVLRVVIRRQAAAPALAGGTGAEPVNSVKLVLVDVHDQNGIAPVRS